jgi:hypothetical protein
MKDEQLAMILTQVSYLCDRLAVELPKLEPGSATGEICAAQRAKIVSHLIEEWLATAR